MSNLIVRIIAQNLAKKGFTSAAADMKKFDASVQKATGRMKKMGMVLAGIGVIGLVKFAKFDKSIREIGTLLGDVTEKDIKGMGDEIKKMSAKFGQGVDKMAKAKYDIISAGFTDAADSAKLLEVSAKLAAGGVSTVATTADVLTSVLNSYGKEASDAIHFSDVLFTTVRLGKTTVDQLSSGLGRAAAIAPQVGVSFEELSAATATLTAGGQSTDETITALTAVMNTMLKPMPDLIEKLKTLGFESGEAAFRSLGFAGTLEKLTEGMTKAEIAAFFPNVRALKAIFPLTGTLAAKFTKNVEEMKDVVGATDKAFGKMTKALSFKFDQMKAKVGNALIAIGESLAPVLEELIKLVDAFSKLDAPMQASILVFGLLTIAVGSFATAITIALGPVGLLYAAAGVLAVALGTYAAVAITAKDKTKELGKEAETAASKIEIMRDRLDELNEKQLTIRISQIGWQIRFLAKDFKEGGMRTDVYMQKLRDLKLELKTTKTALENFDKRAKPGDGADDGGEQKSVEKRIETWQLFYDTLEEKDKTAVDRWMTIQDEQLERDTGYMQTKMEMDMILYNSGIDNAQKKRIALMKFGLQETKDKEAEAKKQMLIDQAVARERIAVVREALYDIAYAFGRHTAMAKAALIIQATMDTYAAANRALGALPPPFSFIAAAAALAAGFVNVRRITAMARGGIVDGSGEPVRAQTGMVSQGFDTVPAMLRRGEAVIPTEKTRDNLPAIRQLMSGQRITGDGGGGSGGQTINFNITAMDAQSFEDRLDEPSFRRKIIDLINDEGINLNAGGVTVQGSI